MTTLCLAELDSATLDLLGRLPEGRDGCASQAHPSGSFALDAAPSLNPRAGSVVRLQLGDACAMPRDWRACIVTGQPA